VPAARRSQGEVGGEPRAPAVAGGVVAGAAGANQVVRRPDGMRVVDGVDVDLELVLVVREARRRHPAIGAGGERCGLFRGQPPCITLSVMGELLVARGDRVVVLRVVLREPGQAPWLRCRGTRGNGSLQ